MKKLFLLIGCLMALGASGQQANVKQSVFDYDHAIRWAIRSKAANPYSISFGFLPTYERVEPPIYERKYEIKIGGYSTAGYAKVQYLGGDPKNLDNWKIIKAYISK